MTLIDVQAINRDPTVFRKPDVFDPERFIQDPDLRLKFHRFGLGQRKCLGSKYAHLILLEVLQEMVSRVSILLEDGGDAQINMRSEGLPFFTPFSEFPRFLIKASLEVEEVKSPISPSFEKKVRVIGHPHYLSENLTGPVFEVGRMVQQEKKSIILGISINNSYFSRDLINSLLPHVLKNHDQVFAFIPEEPSIYTFQGLGYSRQDAERRAYQNGKRLSQWVSTHIQQPEQGKVLKWSQDIGKNNIFSWSKLDIHDLYAKNSDFASAVQEATQEVVKEKHKKTITLKDAVQMASHFLLEELAFLWRAHEILNLDPTSDIAYIYHRRWPVFERFVNGEFFLDKKPIPHLGFIVLSME
jgi:tRNA-dependent cyclodipeptide synthase